MLLTVVDIVVALVVAALVAVVVAVKVDADAVVAVTPVAVVR